MKTLKAGVIASGIAIDKASRLLGSARILARQLGVSRHNIRYWRFNTLLPYDKAVAIHVITKGRVSLDELRPDLKLLNRKITITIGGTATAASKY